MVRVPPWGGERSSALARPCRTAAQVCARDNETQCVANAFKHAEFNPTEAPIPLDLDPFAGATMILGLQVHVVAEGTIPLHQPEAGRRFIP